LKENASHEELDKAKEKAKADGGEIKHEFTLIKGFTYAHLFMSYEPPMRGFQSVWDDADVWGE
jgi:hypothetical protein